VDAEELAYAGAARQAQLIRSGEVSARELVELYLERIERHNPKVNAFTEVLGERALVEADAADARRSDGDGDAPLLGVPVAIKDNVDVEGTTTWFGTRAFDDVPAQSDGESVKRLRAAGAVVIGKTTLPELAICGFTESEGWGATRNPWDTSRSPGGSSGGSGAAVAAGLAAVGLATDGGGSIRIPAAFCGLFGLKPQLGRVPLEPHDHWNGLSVSGCVSRSVADTALYLDVLAGTNFREAARSTPGRLRIAISDKPARAILPPIVTDDVKAGLADTEQLLRSLGHDVRRQDPSFGLMGSNFVPRYLAGISEEEAEVPHPVRLERRTRGFAKLGRAYPAAVVRRAIAAARPNGDKIWRSLGEVDVLITPSVGETAIEVGRWERAGALKTLLGMSRTYCFTPIWNHTGQPAAAIPAGFTAAGMPRSVTLVGRPDDEPTLISLAAQIEAERPWADRRPPLG
jgi:amidase